MDKYCVHQKIYRRSSVDCYFFTWSVPNISSINDLNVSTVAYKMKNESTFYGKLSVSQSAVTFTIASSSDYLTCSVSLFNGSKKLLLSKSLNKPTTVDYSKPPYTRYYVLVTLSSGDETCQKLKQQPNTLVIICKIKHTDRFSSKSLKTPVNTLSNSFYNLKTLADAFNNSSESLSKEKVLLQVDTETETVSKAVLCAGSPVFAKMFQSDMKEKKNNTVTFTDIKMPVLKVMVHFLYTGNITVCDSNFDFLCDLYYAADKYDIAALRQLCVDLLLPLISNDNVIQVWKFAYSHDDTQLKSSAIAFIATNIETWFSNNEWKKLINDEPTIAAEVLNFFYS